MIFGPTPLDFSWLATDKETDEVMLRMEEYFISRENYHEKYEAALMDMIQCAFIRSEKEVTQNKVLTMARSSSGCAPSPI